MNYGISWKEKILDIMEVPKGRGRKRQRAYLKKIVAKNFSYLQRDLDLPVHKALWSAHSAKFQPKMIFSRTHYNKTV